MRQQKHRARTVSRAGRVGVVALALGATLGVSGCAAGQIAQTAEEQPAVNGALGQTGKIAIRDASLVYPAQTKGIYAKGSDIELAMTIVSRKTADDKLVKVSSPAASDARVEGSRVVPGSGVLVVGMPSQASEGGAQPNESAAPSATSAVESARDEDQVGHTRVVLQNTTVPVRSGQNIKVTLTFEKAGSVTLTMPVATPEYEKGYRESSGTEKGGEGAEQTGHPGVGGPVEGS